MLLGTSILTIWFCLRFGFFGDIPTTVQSKNEQKCRQMWGSWQVCWSVPVLLLVLKPQTPKMSENTQKRVSASRRILMPGVFCKSSMLCKHLFCPSQVLIGGGVVDTGKINACIVGFCKNPRHPQ